MKWIAVVACAGVMLAGCAKKIENEPSYKGVTVSRWVQLADDRDDATAADALRALRQFSKDDSGVVAVLQKRTSEGSLVAMKSLYIVTRDPGPINRWVAGEMSAPSIVEGEYIIDLVGALGPDAKPLLPTLKGAVGKFSYADQPRVRDLIAIVEKY